jgi:single-strand DNA-binding protein
MPSLNKVILMGNLTRDPEIKHTASGTAVGDIGLAVNRVTKDENGERREEVTFIDVTLWGRTAELAGQYLAKGRLVLIEGRLHLDQWQDKETGANRSKLKVVATNVQFLGGGNREENQPTPQPTQPGQTIQTVPDDGDDIPF